MVLAARIAASSARLLMQTGRYREAIPRAEAAAELAAAAGVPVEEGRAHTALGMSLVLLGEHVEDRVEHVRRRHELAVPPRVISMTAAESSNLSYALLIAGRTREACDVSVAGIQMMRRYGLAAAGGGALTSNTIVLLRMSGRWLEAERLCDEAEAAGLPDGMALRIALSRAELEIATIRQAGNERVAISTPPAISRRSSPMPRSSPTCIWPRRTSRSDARISTPRPSRSTMRSSCSTTTPGSPYARFSSGCGSRPRSPIRPGGCAVGTPSAPRASTLASWP